MTTRGDKKTPEKKARKLVVRKQTVADLAPRNTGSDRIRGGAQPMSRLCKTRDCEQ